MGLKLVTAATAKPVTVDQVKAQAGIESSDWDALLALYLDAATQMVEEWCSGSLCAQVFKPIECAECIDGRWNLSRHNDVAGDWMNIVRMRLNKVADRRITFGDPRAFVEKARRFEEWCEIDLNDLSIQAGSIFNRQRKCIFGLSISEELAIL